MPSPNYNSTTVNYDPRFAIKRPENFRQRVEAASKKLPEKMAKASRQMPEKYQKEVQRKLSRLQKNAPKLAAGLAAGKKSALKAFAGGLFRQIDISTDWLFMLLFSFGLLKDIFDIVFAALGAIPLIGIVGTAIGIIVSFVGDLMFLTLTVTVLVLVGSSIKNRGLAKYFVSTAMEFVAEALPGISWLPWTPVYVLVLYLFVLFDRAHQNQAEAAQTNQGSRPSYAAADNYYEDERLAA